jgi:hypothetical protein
LVSRDGKSLLVSLWNKETELVEIWLLPIAAAPHADAAGRRVISDAGYELRQAHFSPDGATFLKPAGRARNG